MDDRGILGESYNWYQCSVNGDQGNAWVVWDHVSPKHCRIKNVMVLPESMRQRGIGTHVIYDSFLDMYAEGCRRFSGVPVVREFWDGVKGPFKGESEYDLEVP